MSSVKRTIVTSTQAATRGAIKYVVPLGLEPKTFCQ